MKIERSRSFTYHSLQDKDKKVLSILEMLAKKGVISRTEVSKAIGVNIVSISNYIKSFIDKKLVLETGLDASTGGRKPELIELNAKANFVIGVDVEDRLRAVLTDMSMAVKAKAQTKRPSRDEGLSGEIASMVEGLIKTSAVLPGDVRALGIGMDGEDHDSLIKEIGARFQSEVFSGGRISCAAFGERRMNPGADAKNILYISSSVGHGVIIKDGACIESGTAESENIEKTKYLNAWRAGLGIAQIAREGISRGVGTAIVDFAKGGVDNVTEQAVIEAAANEDEIAANIIKNVGTNLGIRVAYLINLFDPEVVVLGGGIEKAGEMILGPIRRTVARYALNRKAKTVNIIPASLGEDASSLGASWLAAREIFLRA